MRRPIRTHVPMPFAIGLTTALLLAPGWSWGSSITELRAFGAEGPYGGCTTCGGQNADDDIPHAVLGDVATFTPLGNIGGDGSYADANATATFGYLHAYADAHRTYNNILNGVPYGLGDAQASAEARFIDYILPGGSSPVGYASYVLTLAITGSHSSQDSSYPDAVTALGSVNWDIRDNVTGAVYAHGGWNSTDLIPQTVLTIPVMNTVATDLMRLEVDLSAGAYVMSTNSNPADLTAVADYSHTLVASLSGVTPGASTVGASGYDYSAAVPEPGTVLLWLPAIAMVVLRGLRRGRLQA